MLTGTLKAGVAAALLLESVLAAQSTTAQKPIGGVATGPPIVPSFEAAMITAPPAELGLDPFYKKYTDAFGIPIVSSEKVNDAALLMARDIVNYMLLKRPDIRAVMVERKSRVLVMAQTEGETDLPERKDWKKPAIDDRRLTDRERATYNAPGGIAGMTDKEYWNGRARGMGGNITSCAEENLIGLPGTRYYGEHITVHEFSHNVMSALRPRIRRCLPRFSRPTMPRRRRASIRTRAGRRSTRSIRWPSTSRRVRSGGSGPTSSSTTGPRRRGSSHPTSSRPTTRRSMASSSGSTPGTTFPRTSITVRT
jgi:hypothetical protein